MESLERAIDECQHGGPPVRDEDQEAMPTWLIAGTQFLQARTPRLEDLMSDFDSSTTTHQQIGEALEEMRQIILQNPVLHFTRPSPKCLRFFGALAVDAYRNQDMPFVKTFLLKAYIPEYLQQEGPEATPLDSPGQERHKDTLIRDARAILNEQELCHYLTRSTRNACQCPTLATLLHRQYETKVAKAERLRREAEQLPAILKESSPVFRLKQKAATHLKGARYQESLAVYRQAITLLEKELNEAVLRITARKVSEEVGRIYCNMSLLSMKLKQTDNALNYSESAVTHFPNWSKPHSRRALALEAMGHLDLAEDAICKAIDEVEHEADDHAASEKMKAEYLQIQQRIQQKKPLADIGTTEVSSNVIVNVDGESDAHMGTLNGLKPEIVDLIVAFLPPRDWAQLEQTCRSFASIPEKRRRLALSSPLRNSRYMKMEPSVDMYCNKDTEDPSCALQDLVASSLSYCLPESLLPVWLEQMLDHAPVPKRNFMEAFCIRKYPNWLERTMQRRALDRVKSLVNGGFDRDDILRIYRNDFDGDAMRIASWFSFEEGNGEVEIAWQTVYTLLRPLLVLFVRREREDLRLKGPEESTARHIHKLVYLYNVCLPSRMWPCETESESEWMYTADDIDKYWNDNNPQVFRSWKRAFRRLLDWLLDTEDSADKMLLLMEGMGFEESLSGRLTLDCNMVGIFFLKRCLQYGGAVALKKSLTHQRDYSELVADCYVHFRLLKTGFSRLVEYNDYVVAQANMR